MKAEMKEREQKQGRALEMLREQVDRYQRKIERQLEKTVEDQGQAVGELSEQTSKLVVAFQALE